MISVGIRTWSTTGICDCSTGAEGISVGTTVSTTGKGVSLLEVASGIVTAASITGTGAASGIVSGASKIKVEVASGVALISATGAGVAESITMVGSVVVAGPEISVITGID